MGVKISDAPACVAVDSGVMTVIQRRGSSVPAATSPEAGRASMEYNAGLSGRGSAW